MSNPQPPAVSFTIFVDGVEYKTDQASMVGAAIKTLAGKDLQYDLFLEMDGGQPDRKILNTEAVAMRNGLHFYTAPPASFGLSRE